MLIGLQIAFCTPFYYTYYLETQRLWKLQKINTILHSHEVWLSQSAYLPHWAENILEQGKMWGGWITSKSAADTVTQKIPSAQQAGSNGEKRDAVSSWVWKRGPLRAKFTLIYRSSLAVILFRVCYPAAIPGKPTIQKQCLNPWSYLTCYQGPSWPML